LIRCLLAFERDDAGGSRAKYELVSYVRGTSWTTREGATFAHYVALVRKEKRSRTWICYDDDAVTPYARVYVVVGWLGDSVRVAVYLRIDRTEE
jgi:ubiquitin C-terminal hydrolase